MKTIMVTGSQGYIGSNLCKVLIEQGYNIIQIDKKIGSDILTTDFWEHDPDVVVHLAAIASIGDCEIDKSETVRDNVLTCQVISNYCSDKGIPVVFASSQAMKNPTSSMYAMTKFIGEQIFNTINDNINLRFANVYGGINFIEDKTSVVAKWIRRYERGDNLIINGSGSQTRDFVYVEDLCNVIISLIERGNWNSTMDVGTGIETSIIELSRMFPTDARFDYDYDSDMVGIASNVADTLLLDNMNIVPTNSVEDYLKEYFG